MYAEYHNILSSNLRGNRTPIGFFVLNFGISCGLEM